MSKNSGFSSTAIGRLMILILYHEVYCPRGISYEDGYYYFNFFEVSRKSRGRVSRLRLDIEILIKSGLIVDYEDVSRGVGKFRLRSPTDLARYKGILPEARFGKAN